MRCRAAIVLLTTLAAIGCSSESYTKVVDTPSDGWHRAAILTFESRDTTELYDISLLLRCRVAKLDEAEERITLNIVTTTPTMQRVAEPLSIEVKSPEIAVDRGVALIEVPYRNSVQWREIGEYHMTIFPTKATDGVESVGVTIRPKREKEQEDI